MAFDMNEATTYKNELLERVREARQILEREVENYYWERVIDSPEEERTVLEASRRYLIQVDDILEQLLRTIDGRIGY